MQKRNYFLTLITLFTFSILANAQETDYSAHNIYKGFLGWDIRFGGERHSIDTKNINTIINTVSGTENSVYKSPRITAELLTVDWAGGFNISKRIKLGYVLGFHGGFIYQNEKLTTTTTGVVFNGEFPADYGGGQGNLGGRFTLNVEIKGGLSAAYEINKANNINISAGYSARYWPQTALGFYTLPKFIGGFADINMTYKKCFLYTTFRSKNILINENVGKAKTSYVSIMPTYTTSKGYTLGVRFEGASAKYNSTYTIQSTRTEQQLKANSFNMGLYFGFLL